MKNKIKKVSKKQTLSIAGGYAGEDWAPGYQYIYDRLGIKHIKNTLSSDEYFLEGERIPWKFVCAVTNGFLGASKYYLAPTKKQPRKAY